MQEKEKAEEINYDLVEAIAAVNDTPASSQPRRKKKILASSDFGKLSKKQKLLYNILTAPNRNERNPSAALQKLRNLDNANEEQYSILNGAFEKAIEVWKRYGI